MVRVDGDLDPEAGETLLTALRAVMDAGSRSGSGGDDRTPPQRRADALHEICRQWLDLAERPTVAGERPHVTVTVDARALAGASSGAGELDHVGAVDVTVARQLSCDSSVMRVVMAGRAQPLDVGRRTPIVPPAIRRAVIVRDRICRRPCSHTATENADAAILRGSETTDLEPRSAVPCAVKLNGGPPSSWITGAVTTTVPRSSCPVTGRPARPPGGTIRW